LEQDISERRIRPEGEDESFHPVMILEDMANSNDFGPQQGVVLIDQNNDESCKEGKKQDPFPSWLK
jgi:hypothetical protein